MKLLVILNKEWGWLASIIDRYYSTKWSLSYMFNYSSSWVKMNFYSIYFFYKVYFFWGFIRSVSQTMCISKKRGSLNVSSVLYCMIYVYLGWLSLIIYPKPTIFLINTSIVRSVPVSSCPWQYVCSMSFNVHTYYFLPFSFFTVNKESLDVIQENKHEN